MSADAVPVRECACPVCTAGSDPATQAHHRQINLLLSRLSEPQRRWYVGVLSQAPDSPSDRQLAAITGLDPKTIQRGRAELAQGLADFPSTRQRRPGGGRPLAQKKIPP